MSIGTKKGNLFHINRIYTPVFNISYRTRGGYNFVIRNDLFSKMISKACESKEIFVFNAKKENINEPKGYSIDENSTQISLFD